MRSRGSAGPPSIRLTTRRLFPCDERVGRFDHNGLAPIDPGSASLVECVRHRRRWHGRADTRRPCRLRPRSAASWSPSSTRCGARLSRTASLALSGSPSAPLATTIGLAAGDRGDLAAGGKAGAAAPGQPAGHRAARSIRLPASRQRAESQVMFGECRSPAANRRGMGGGRQCGAAMSSWTPGVRARRRTRCSWRAAATPERRQPSARQQTANARNHPR